MYISDRLFCSGNDESEERQIQNEIKIKLKMNKSPEAVCEKIKYNLPTINKTPGNVDCKSQVEVFHRSGRSDIYADFVYT